MSTEYSFSAEIPDLMGLIINSIYSNKEIFLRELVSNASDALDKIKYESLTNKEVLNSNTDMKIKILPNKEEKTLVIEDDGIGMTKEDLINNLGTIAKSGTKNFLKELKENKKDLDLNMIGQFGVGFYSAYLVSDKVTVITKNNKDEEYIWTSDAKTGFSIEQNPTPSLKRGTKIICHLKDDASEFLEENNIKDIIKKHSQYINFPIELYVEKEIEEDVEESQEKEENVETQDDLDKVEIDENTSDEDDSQNKTVKKIVNEWEVLNKQKPIWTRKSSEVTEEEYKDFYKSITNSWDECSYYKHFSVEGSLELDGLIYLPKAQPFDMFKQSKENKSIKLFVKRVFITDDCKELVPEWLSFIKGVVDSNDLPLNVSRELLQQTKTLRLIKKQVVKKAIEMITELADNEEKYNEFYNSFHKQIKLGIHEDSDNRIKLSKLLRFHSLNSQETKISLDSYLENMKEGENKIFYISGESVKSVINSPFLEKLKMEGHDVLLLVDPIDEYVIQQLKKYQDKDLVSVASNDFKLDSEVEELKDLEEKFKGLCDRFKTILSGKVENVKLGTRILDSPCCIVTDSQGYSANMQRIIKAQAMGNDSMMEYMASKKSMEINPKSKIIMALNNKFEKNAEDKIVTDLITLLYEMSLLTSGFTLEDPSSFAKKFSRMISLGLSIDDEDDEDDLPELEETYVEIEDTINMEQVD